MNYFVCIDLHFLPTNPASCWRRVFQHVIRNGCGQNGIHPPVLRGRGLFQARVLHVSAQTHEFNKPKIDVEDASLLAREEKVKLSCQRVLGGRAAKACSSFKAWHWES